MLPYDRVMDVLRGGRGVVDRPPVMSPMGTATEEFMDASGASWPEAHKEPGKMAKLASAAHRLCGLESITVPFELTLEAEVLGATLNFHEGKIKWPSVKEFTVKEFADLKFPPSISTAGRIPVVVEAIKILKREFDGKIPVVAYINCPFTSLGSYLVDSVEFFRWVVNKPARIHEFYGGVKELFAEVAVLFKEAGADIITLREEAACTDNISPTHFETFIKPYLSHIISRVKPPRILHICGSTETILEKMVECGAEAISIDYRDPIDKARKLVDARMPRYPLAGNIDPVKTISNGPPARIRGEVRRAVEGGVDIVAPGCDLWIKTPNAHLKAFVQVVQEMGGLRPGG